MGVVGLTGEMLVEVLGHNAPGESRLSFSATLGGAMLNTASVLAQLGTPTRFIGEVGQDFLGDWAIQRLDQGRIERRFVQQPEGVLTPLVVKQVDTFNNARYSLYRVFGDTQFNPDKGALARVKWFHFGSLSAFERRNIAGITSLLEIAQEYDIMVSFDPDIQTRPDEDYFEQFRKYLPYISVLKASYQDAKILFPGTPNSRLLLEHLAGLGVPVTVMTLGAEGALAWFRGRIIRVPGVKVKVVDTVGAGDTFSAALIYGMLKQELESRIGLLTWEGTQLPVILSAACHLAALACMVAGPGVPQKELQNWWERYG